MTKPVYIEITVSRRDSTNGWFREATQRAADYAERYAQVVADLWGLPFDWNDDSGFVTFRLPAASQWRFGGAVTDWIGSGQGEMPNPKDFID